MVFEAQTSDGESPDKSLAGICFCQIRRGMTKTSDGEVPRHPPYKYHPENIVPLYSLTHDLWLS